MEAKGTKPGDQTEMDDQLIRRCESIMPALVSELKEAHAAIATHDEGRKILSGLFAATVAQEVVVMAIEDRDMAAGEHANLGKDELIRDWQALSRHYARTKYERVFENGAEQLAKLSDEEAEEVIIHIRKCSEPLINEVWGHTKSTIKLEIPVVGSFKWRFSGNLKGPRAGIKRIQHRTIRTALQGMLWISIGFWAIHWGSWTLFGKPYLTENYTGLANVTGCFMLGAATLVLWALMAGDKRKEQRGVKRILRKSLRGCTWLIIASGWGYWASSLMFEIPSGNSIWDGIHKLAVLFFVVFGSLGAWTCGVILRRLLENQSTGDAGTRRTGGNARQRSQDEQ